MSRFSTPQDARLFLLRHENLPFTDPQVVEAVGALVQHPREALMLVQSSVRMRHHPTLLSVAAKDLNGAVWLNRNWPQWVEITQKGGV